MSFLKKMQSFVVKPSRIQKKFVKMIAPFIKDDERFIKMRWKVSDMGYALDLDNPSTYNEKLQWLKLHDRRAEYTRMVDKVEAKEWVKGRIGDEYVIPTLCVYNNVSDIEWDKLPSQFVMKCTHDSGGVVICKDKSNFDIREAKKILKRGIKRNFYWVSREWPYKNVKRRIIVEKYLENKAGELTDYKFFCFNGIPKFLFVATDRGSDKEETKFDFFDMDFQHLNIINGHPNAYIKVIKPKSFELMKSIASKLSDGFAHVRVDLYEVNGHVYFGEMTFYHWSGFVPFVPSDWDRKIGEWLTLPQGIDV